MGQPSKSILDQGEELCSESTSQYICADFANDDLFKQLVDNSLAVEESFIAFNDLEHSGNIEQPEIEDEDKIPISKKVIQEVNAEEHQGLEVLAVPMLGETVGWMSEALDSHTVQEQVPEPEEEEGLSVSSSEDSSETVVVLGEEDPADEFDSETTSDYEGPALICYSDRTSSELDLANWNPNIP